ncbi:MAG: RidA family protein [Thermodesulfovibrionales bacterium]|nr:RidA family protein [Thermodesulfovibrionales bacterium]
MTPEERLKELGIELPPAPKPLGSYVPAVRSGNLVFLSGILPLREGRLQRTGLVGRDLTLDEAHEEAIVCVINALSVLKADLGDLGRVKRCVRLCGYVASAPGFTEQPKVLNPASDLLCEVFGEAGRHARAAVGVSALPMNSPLEIEFIFEVSD